MKKTKKCPKCQKNEYKKITESSTRKCTFCGYKEEIKKLK